MHLRALRFLLVILVIALGCQQAVAQTNDRDHVAVAKPAELIEIIKRNVWPDTDIATRMAAQKRIEQLGKEAPDQVVPLIIRELETIKRHDKSTVQKRIALIETLRDIGPAAEAASNVLIEILQDADEPNEWVGMAARMALDRIGTADGQKALAEDSKSHAREFASKASDEELRRSAEHSAFLMRQELRRPRPHEGVLTAGLDNLTASGERAANTLPTLLRAYRDPRLSPGAKSKLARAITAMGMTEAQLADEAAQPPADIDPFKDLMADVANPDDFINSLAMSELGKLGPSERAIDALIAALDKGHSPGAAANALGAFGPAADRAAPHLIPYLTSRKIGANAIQAVGKIGVKDAGVINELRRIVRSENSAHRGMAADALSKLGVLKALPDLQLALTDKGKYTRILVANAIARFGEDAAPAVEDLGNLLGDPDDDVGRAAVNALGSIGPAAQPVATSLAGALHSENDRLRKAAERAIDRIGGPVAEATKASRIEAYRTQDLIAAQNLIAGSKFGDLGNLLNRLPAPRKLALSRSLADHGNVEVAYIANSSRMLHDGDDEAVRRVVEIILQHERGRDLLQGLSWSMAHGAGEADIRDIMAKLVKELRAQLQSAPLEIQERFKELLAPQGSNNE